MTTLEKAREARANEKTAIQAGVQAVLPEQIKPASAAQGINDELVSRFHERQAAIKAGAELVAPTIAKNERYSEMSEDEQAISEMIEKIMEMVEKLMQKIGLDVCLTGENVNARHRAIAEAQISKELEYLEKSESSNQSFELKKSEIKNKQPSETKTEAKTEEKEQAKTEEITAADVLRGGVETYKQFKAQQQEKKQEAKAMNENKTQNMSR